MKATISNDYVLDGKYLNAVGNGYATFYVPKGECDMELIAAATAGIINRMSSFGQEWCLTIESNKITWED